MTIRYSTDDRCTVEETANIFMSSGIRRPCHDIDRIRRMLEHADEIVTARDGEKLVGLLRAITDYSYCCYISDLAVNRSYHGQGIGTELVGQLKLKLGNEEIQYVLTSAPKSSGFYERIGFAKAENAFVIKRQIN
ncbi:GNAT family N-acetyltransferase [Paenibacillus silviterrae]|uniref:GNAT family N-acetyltransferase n=1 Tax=Paenibacillus silviterrae TaxID=3242194 RepID=UPI00254339AD|nr:GNAT family N-acetyltransferase [Paenibacillus chinjuensis]